MVAAGHLVSHIDYKRTNNDLAKCKRKSYICSEKKKENTRRFERFRQEAGCGK